MTTVKTDIGARDDAYRTKFAPAGGIVATDVERAILEVRGLVGSGGSAAIYVMDGGGVALTPGVKGDLLIPFNCTVTAWTILADQTGSVVIDVWKAALVSYPPTILNTITGTDMPTLVASLKAQSTALTGWTTAIASGETLRFNINSSSTIQRLTLTLSLARS